MPSTIRRFLSVVAVPLAVSLAFPQLSRADVDTDEYNTADKLARYANWCTVQHRFNDSQEAYKKLIHLYPDTAEATSAKAALKRLQRDIEVMPAPWVKRLSALDYYLVDTVNQYIGRHYDSKQMPINIYAYPAGEDARDAVNAAIAGWNTGADGFITLKRVTSPEEADIEIMFTSDRTNPKVLDRQGTTSMMSPRNGRLHFETTVLLVDHYTNARITLPRLCHTVTHELGHALGLGHSGAKSDVMYAGGPGYMPTDNDIAMLRIVYTLPAEQLCAKAIEAVNKAGFTDDYGIARLYAMQGVIYRRLNNYDTAIEWFGKAYDLHSKFVDDPEVPNGKELALRDIASIVALYKYEKKDDLVTQWEEKRAQLHDDLQHCD